MPQSQRPVDLLLIAVLPRVVVFRAIPGRPADGPPRPGRAGPLRRNAEYRYEKPRLSSIRPPVGFPPALGIAPDLRHTGFSGDRRGRGQGDDDVCLRHVHAATSGATTALSVYLARSGPATPCGG